MKLTHALSALPFLGILGGIFFNNRVQPYVLGLPFALFWVTALGDPDRADHGSRLPPGSPMNAALAVIVAVVALAVGLALRSRRGHDMDLEQ